MVLDKKFFHAGIIIMENIDINIKDISFDNITGTILKSIDSSFNVTNAIFNNIY